MAEEAFQLGALADEFAGFGGVKLGVEIRAFELGEVNLVDGQQPLVAVADFDFGEDGCGESAS